MKTINSENGVFGPFREVNKTFDRLIADGIEYPLDAIGSYEITNGVPIGVIQEPVPESVPMLNARTVLYSVGILEAWENLLSNMTGEEGDLARIKWATALTVKRHDPLVISGLQGLGKTPEEGDRLFIQAAGLTV